MYLHYVNAIDQDVADKKALEEEVDATKAHITAGMATRHRIDSIVPRMLGSDLQKLQSNWRRIEYDPNHETCTK